MVYIQHALSMLEQLHRASGRRRDGEYCRISAYQRSQTRDRGHVIEISSTVDISTHTRRRFDQRSTFFFLGYVSSLHSTAVHCAQDNDGAFQERGQTYPSYESPSIFCSRRRIKSSRDRYREPAPVSVFPWLETEVGTTTEIVSPTKDVSSIRHAARSFFFFFFREKLAPLERYEARDKFHA